MFLQDLCYISSVNTGAPVGSGADQKTLLKLLEKIFAGPVIRYDAINGQEVTINTGVNLNKTTILEINDGMKSIFSRVNVLDNNTFYIIDDISELNKDYIVISYPKMQFKIDVDAQTLENIFAKISFDGQLGQQHVSTIITSKITMTSNKTNTLFLYNDASYEIIYNDVFLFIKFSQNGSFTPIFFLLNENLILARNMGVALTTFDRYQPARRPWQCVTFGVETGLTIGGPTVGGTKFAVTNLLVFGEKASYICSPSGAIPGQKNKSIYFDIVNNKNLFLFYSNDMNDDGYYLLFGGAS